MTLDHKLTVYKKLKYTYLDINSDAGQCDVAVNCTGLGARWLCNDAEVLPIRGQVGNDKSTYYLLTLFV